MEPTNTSLTELHLIADRLGNVDAALVRGAAHELTNLRESFYAIRAIMERIDFTMNGRGPSVDESLVDLVARLANRIDDMPRAPINDTRTAR